MEMLNFHHIGISISHWNTKIQTPLKCQVLTTTLEFSELTEISRFQPYGNTVISKFQHHGNVNISYKLEFSDPNGISKFQPMEISRFHPHWNFKIPNPTEISTTLEFSDLTEISRFQPNGYTGISRSNPMEMSRFNSNWNFQISLKYQDTNAMELLRFQTH